VASEYAHALLHELEYKPLDRALLAVMVEEARGGRLMDVGCGPGQVAGWLHARGATVSGLDASPAMVDIARAQHAGVEFEVGDLFALGRRDLAGIVAFYCIVNFPPADLPGAGKSFFEALAPGGLLLLSFHLGREQLHLDEWFGERVSIDFWLHERAEVERALEAAGFAIEMRLERKAYAQEHPTQRCYLLARRG
jgi:SAM-dependent methyltransferase